MNYKNFENASQKKTDSKQDCFIKSVPGSGKSFYAKPSDIPCDFEDRYEMFIEISKILERQENRKRRFYKKIKNALFIFFSIFVFSGIIIFAKKHKASKDVKTKKI